MTDALKFDDLPEAPAVPKFDDLPEYKPPGQHAPTFTEAVRGLMPAPLSAVTEGAKNIREGFSPSQPTPMLERARNVASGAFDIATPALPRGFRKELKDKVNEGLATINANLNPFSEEQQKLFKEEMAHPGIESQWKKFKSVGEGLGGVGEVVFSPLTAAASTVSPLIAAPEATLFAQPDKINPFTGKPQTRENLYPQLKSGAELAFSAGRPGKMPASVSPHAPAAPPPPPEAPFGVNLTRGQETRNIHDLRTQHAAEQGYMEPATTEPGQQPPRPITEFAQARAAERAQQIEDAKDIATAQLSPEGDIQARTAEEAGQSVKTALQAQEAERARHAAAEAERLRAKEIQSPADAAEVVHDALTQRAAAQAAHTDAEATARAADIEGMRTSYSPDGQVYARTPMEAGDVMSRGVEAAEARATARRDELYDVVDNHTGHIDPKNYVNIESEIKQTFKDPKDPFVTSKETTPITLRAIDQISEDLGAPARAAAEAGSYSITPFTPQAIGTVRKKLVQRAQDAASGASRSNNYSDVAGMQRVMEKFDDIFGRGARSHYNPETSVIQEAVNQAQGKQAKINAARRARYEAGQQVVADWEAARAAHRYLRKTFSAQGSGDRVGPLMARIVGRNNLDLQAMPGEELGRHLTRNPLLGRHLAELFPEGTIERAAAKQGILEGAIGVPEGNAPLSAQKIAENLNKLRSSEVGRTWFSGPELEAMRAQAVRQQAAVPAPRAKTDFGKKVEDIVGEGGTPWTREQLAEKLYSKHGPESEKLVRHIKDTFGEDSEAFQAIQRGQLAALTRAEKGVAGFNPKEIAQDVRSFLRTDKSKILYTPEMRTRLAQYADQLEMHAWETAASKDPVQAALARLREASPQEAANMLLGKSENAVKLGVIRHLQRTAPDTIVALRQAVFRRMIEPSAAKMNDWTPLHVHDQIAKYLGDAPGVMRELFGPEGIKVLKEYQELQKKLHIPDEAKKNWNMPGFSRVVAAINKKAGDYIHMMMGLVGLHTSGNPWVAGAAMGASKFAGNWFASRVQAATFRKQMAEVRRLLPSAAEKLAEWQKAVDASHATGHLPPYRAREAAAWTTASQIFDKLGLNLHQLIYRGSAAADDDENKRGVEKKRQAGGGVTDEPEHADDSDATVDPAELAAAQVRRRYPQQERKRPDLLHNTVQGLAMAPDIMARMLGNMAEGITTLPERAIKGSGEFFRQGEASEFERTGQGDPAPPASIDPVAEAALMAVGTPLQPTRLFKPLPGAAAAPKSPLRIAEHPERQFEGRKTGDDAWTFGSGARDQEGRAALAAATEGASREAAPHHGEFRLPREKLDFYDKPHAGGGDEGWNLDELTSSIKAEGLKNPVEVGRSKAEIAKGNNSVYVFNGNHRLEAANRADLKDIRSVNSAAEDAVPLTAQDIRDLGGTTGRAPTPTREEFEKAAMLGRIHPAANDKTTLARVMRGDQRVTDLNIRGDYHPLGRAYENGTLEKHLERSGLHVEDDRMGNVIVGRTQADIDRLKAAQTPLEFGRAYGYGEDDIAHFYNQRRGGDASGYDEYARDYASAAERGFDSREGSTWGPTARDAQGKTLYSGSEDKAGRAAVAGAVEGAPHHVEALAAARDLGLPTAKPNPDLPTYLRVSAWNPKYPQSRNYAKGDIEPGLSVYELDKNGRPVTPAEGEWAEMDMADRLRGEEPKFLVQGEHVGQGHDGEPLLGNVRVVGGWKNELGSGARDQEGRAAVADAVEGAPKATRWTTGKEVPPEPGTAPIPEGHVRLYHQTGAENLPSIAQHGIELSRARGIEGPKAIYADDKGFYGKPGDTPTVEFHVPKQDYDRPFVKLDKVPPENIVGIHYPWHSHARYIEKNPKVLANVRSGQHDDLLSDSRYGPAIAHVKAKSEQPTGEAARMARATEQGWGTNALRNEWAGRMLDDPEYGKLPHVVERNKPIEHTWFHGTQADFDEFRTGGIKRQTGDWNTMLGPHFSDSPGVAGDFAEGRYSGSPEGGRVLPVQLKIHNPKRYKTETDLSDDAVRWAVGNGKLTADDFKKGGADARGIGAEVAKTGAVPDWGYGFGGEVLKAAGNKRKPIADGFRKSLQEQGFDGIVYGNNVEGVSTHAAIPFNANQVRSKFAQFDPANEGKGTILGSGARDQEGRAALAAVTESGGPAASRVVRRAADETGAGVSEHPLAAMPATTPWTVAEPIVQANANKGLQFPPADSANELRLHLLREQKVAAGGEYPGGPANARTVVRAPKAKEGEQQLPDFVTGNLTPQDWVKRQEALMTPAEIHAAASWYKQIRGEFLKQTKGNVELADRYMRAWLVAQQNIGPPPAMSNVLLQSEQIARGVPEGKMRAGGMPNPTKAARSVLRNQPIEEGVGVKIADFVDSAEGKPVRSWMANHPDGGRPFVVDVHSARDTGLVDPTLKNLLAARGYNRADLDKLAIDFSEGGIKGPPYENRARFGRELTDYLNEIGWQGRSDWTPNEVQAVGWMGMTRLTHNREENVLDALTRNQRNISMELSPGAGSPWAKKYGADYNALSPSDQLAITHEITNDAIDLASKLTGIDRGTIVNGTGAWLQYPANPSTVAQTFATRDGADNTARVLGHLLSQTEVWSTGVKPVTSSPKGFAIDFIDQGNHTLTDPNGVSAFWAKVMDADPYKGGKGTKSPLFQGYQPIKTRDGEHGIRILVDRGGKTIQDALEKAVAPGGALDTMLKALPEEQTFATALHEAEIAKHRNDWTKDKNGQAYIKGLVKAWGRNPTADLRRAGGQLEKKLGDLIAAARGRSKAGPTGPEGGQEVARARGGAVKGGCHWCSLIDTKHDIKSGADSSARRVVIDRHIPEFSPTLKTRDGKPANLHKYLSRHERAEALGMRSGLSYADAHDKRAVPAERSAVRGDGVDWDAYNREMAGYLSHVEHEQVRKPPPGKLHVDPGKAIRTRQSGGGVIRGDQMSPLKSEHITENDLRDFNRQMERNLKSPMAGELELEGGQRSENDRYGVPREPIQKLYDFWDRGEEVSLTRQSGGGVLDWAYAPKLDLRTPEDPKKAYAAGYERDPPPLAKPPIAGSYEDGRAGLDLTMSGEGSSGSIGASVDPFKPSSWGVRGSYKKDITAGRAAGGRVVAAAINHRPTEAQQKAGNYAKDHVCIHGLDITIENARGSTRRGVGKDGKPWKAKLPAHYGYIKRTAGADGDHVDVYLGPHTASTRVWVIDQVDPDEGRFDEHKTFLGFASKAQVIRTYRAAFSDGRGLERAGAIKELTIEAFKRWLGGDTTKPLNDKVPKVEPMIQRAAFQYHEKATGDRCEVCRYYSGPQGCGLYRMLNQRMPEDFDLNPQVARDGWCSAYTDKRAKT